MGCLSFRSSADSRAAAYAPCVGQETRDPQPFAERDGLMLLKFVFRDPRDFHEGAEQPDLQRLVSVDGYDDSLSSSLHGVDVVAPVDSREDPASPLNGSSKISA